MPFWSTLLFLFTFVALVWQTHDILRATYRLVKSGSGPQAELSRVDSRFGAVFVMMAFQWHFLFWEEVANNAIVWCMYMLLAFASVATTTALALHVFFSWKFGVPNKTS